MVAGGGGKDLQFSDCVDFCVWGRAVGGGGVVMCKNNRRRST